MKVAKSLLSLVLILLLLESFTFWSVAEKSEADHFSQWEKEVIELAETLPVQEGGRLKPLHTFARFKLLKINGRSTCTNLVGKKISPTEWLLDCLFFPEVSKSYKIFLIQNDAVLDAIQLDHGGRKKRDRYTYMEISQGRKKLFEFAAEFSKIEEKKRDLIQAQIVNLSHNIADFEWLIHYLDFARTRFPVNTSSGLKELFKDADTASFMDILGNGPSLRAHFFQIQSQSELDPEYVEKEKSALTELLTQVDNIGSRSNSIALFPPAAEMDSSQWITPTDIMEISLSGKGKIPDQLQVLGLLEEITAVQNQPLVFKEKFLEFHQQVKKLAEEGGDYASIPLEVKFYKGKFFYYGLLLYVLSFILVAISWLKPRSEILPKIIWTTLTGATLLLVIGIVLRCIIRARPPVSTLYETILFITAVAVIVTLILEFINRQKIAYATGSLLGAMGLFLANKYEVKEGSDTMTSLVAVLDSNYWLATHVTTVTIGYAAGLLACAIAHLYIVGKFFGIKKGDLIFYKNISRMVYGVLCFGLLFSVVGTILGGVWANDSWGRFWGWDPKENGALMIILWELTILHARIGGYIRDRGVCLSAIVLGCIVAFSWWGVNLLGVGLHSYGWTSGVYNTLLIFYGVEGLILILGIMTWVRDRNGLQPRSV